MDKKSLKEQWEQYINIWTFPVYYHLVLLFFYLILSLSKAWPTLINSTSYLIEISFLLMLGCVGRYYLKGMKKSYTFLGISIFFLFAITFFVMTLI